MTLLDNWGNGGADFTRTIPFHKLKAVMNRAEVEAARQADLVVGEQSRGFFLAAQPRQSQEKAEQAKSPSETPDSTTKPQVVSGIQTPRGPLTGTGSELIQASPLKQSGLKL